MASSSLSRPPLRTPLSSRRGSPVAAILAAAGALSLVALGIALVAQHGYDIQPCAWCVMQRIVLIAVAAAALAGAIGARISPRAAGLVAGAVLLALSAGGAVAAWHQHTVASKQLSCAFTWADRTLMSLQLDAWWPAMFRVGATCADAARSTLLGLPFEVWGGAWFAFVAVAAVAVLAISVRGGSVRGGSVRGGSVR
jgi:disulfide bond formation protein DsbB